MSVHTKSFVWVNNNQSPKTRVASGSNFSHESPSRSQKVPVVHHNLHGKKLVIQNAESRTNKGGYNPSRQNNYHSDHSTQGQKVQSSNRKMLPFQKGFKLKKAHDYDQEDDNFQNEFENKNSEKSKNKKTNLENDDSSNIDDLFDNTEPEKTPVCNLFGICSKKTNDSKDNVSNYNMLKLTGYMSSFFDMPDFTDGQPERKESRVSRAVSNCCTSLKNKFNNHVAKYSSILSQNSLDASCVGCFGLCTNKLSQLLNPENLSNVSTDSSYGPKGSYESLSSGSQKGFFSPSQSLDQSVPTNMFKEAGTKLLENGSNLLKEAGTKLVQDGSKFLQQNRISCLNAPYDRRDHRKNHNNVNALNYKLHAVEVHQYVPTSNRPNPPFQNGNKGGSQFREGPQNRYPQSSFNPKHSGQRAPMMNNLAGMNTRFPENYSLKEVKKRLKAQDLAA